MKQKQNYNRSKKNQPSRNTQTQKAKIDLFGMHAVSAAWVNPKRHIHNLYITDAALDGFDQALKTAHDMGLKRPNPQIVDKGFLDHSTPMGSVHQGIGLNCQALEDVDIHDLIRANEMREKTLLVMLDQVTDPHNVGAIIRSACVFGAAGMIMQKKHAPDLTGVLAKTACGGVEHVPVAYETNLTRSLETLQDAGYFAVGLAEEGDDNLKNFSNHEKLVLVLGAEGDGLRRLVREQCDALTRLPTAGPISSLNVSNAAAVAFYAVCS
ncbi:MAG: 23S rRNA (guanosine(2251)-2'-O)-methyltransferase RlmB [Alphaproteobacteria bacterium]|nr:23S rRNA (guanosine(2251)-2'-O)-methyltransferase RlmB [Alphaproteobacteria bacterium]